MPERFDCDTLRKRGTACQCCMFFGRYERGTPECHHRIPDKLVDDAAVLLYRIGLQAEVPVK